ncbi:MAG: kelch repeat-containing protein, partial [Chitinophagaceae bacterium]
MKKNYLLLLSTLFLLLNSINAQITTNTPWIWVKGTNTLNSPGVYGIKGVASSLNNPGARDAGVTWNDNKGNLWLFGGYGYDVTGTGSFLNDLWKYDIGSNQWTWMSGDNIINQTGVYGIQGVPSAANKPGARSGSCGWKDNNGNLWLFGGLVIVPGGYEVLNDLWKYDIKNNQWTWMKGSQLGAASVYGTQGVPDNNNVPGSRGVSVSWTDANGKFWLFGGGVISFNFTDNGFNDLWKYDPATNQWAWMKGDPVTINPPG